MVPSHCVTEVMDPKDSDAYGELSLHAEYLQKQVAILQRENKQLQHTQQQLETQLEGREETLASSQKEVTLLIRKNQDLQSRLDEESHRYDLDRTLWLETESQIARRMTAKRARRATVSHQITGGSMPTFCTRCEGEKIKLDMEITKRQGQNERKIAYLEAELNKQDQDHHQAMQRQQRYLTGVEAELNELRKLHTSLMEENEGFRWANQLDDHDTEVPAIGSLASEISQTTDDTTLQELYAENRCLKEANDALATYMDKILSKIVGDHTLVDILNVDDLPIPKERPRRSTISHSPQDTKSWSKAFKRMSMLNWSKPSPEC
ncbi:hypothetical protein DM01DRAFT_1387204 [Hesseltinella vesiculosa]|uniref:Uncharacterized protein n=1 Tax=Hesseltinella vesiculosa TaxID=101127 RepID=A0A1X2G2U4_9FUNG|nr:hypothetical protein DM01DRAFT_1387204 [Hesseltinella vesiculosa]